MQKGKNIQRYLSQETLCLMIASPLILLLWQIVFFAD